MPVIPLAIWWGRIPRADLLRRAALLLAAMALVIAPWTIRNERVMHAFIPVSNNASWTLGSAHGPKANGGEVETAETAVDKEKGSSETEPSAGPPSRRDRMGPAQPAQGAGADSPGR